MHYELWLWCLFLLVFLFLRFHLYFFHFIRRTTSRWFRILSLFLIFLLLLRLHHRLLLLDLVLPILFNNNWFLRHGLHLGLLHGLPLGRLELVVGAVALSGRVPRVEDDGPVHHLTLHVPQGRIPRGASLGLAGLHRHGKYFCLCRHHLDRPGEKYR